MLSMVSIQLAHRTVQPNPSVTALPETSSDSPPAIMFVAEPDRNIVATQTPPNHLGVAVRLVARLGGDIGRHTDPPPGHQVIWRGLAQLITLCKGFLLGKASLDPVICG